MPPMPWLKKLPLWRLGLAMATITILVFVGVLSAVITAGTIQGNASAVNEAGSLRMQLYRITSTLLFNQEINSDGIYLGQVMQDELDKFEHRLYSHRLINVLPDNRDHELRSTYATLVGQWKLKIRPMLLAHANVHDQMIDSNVWAVSTEEEQLELIQADYLFNVNNFVLDVDAFVGLLEKSAEDKISLLKAIQAVTLILTLSVVLITMYLLRAKILGPLSSLLYCAENTRKGNFSVRTSYTDDDELGQVGLAFNAMAEDLSKMHANWEACVQEKTVDLERSNRSLELLYNTIKRLSEAPLSDSTYDELLRDLEEPLGIGPGAICLSDNHLDKPFVLASTRKTLRGGPDICAQANCHACFGDGDTHLLEMPHPDKEKLQLISIPIMDQDIQVGVLLMEVRQDVQLEEWQKQLLEAVAHHIGLALNISQRVTESRRLALLEERSVIARELHDSLAQSLSYLKIQATRLDMALAKSSNGDDVSPIIGEMREGISSAYRQLRELLTTFRLKMDGRGLVNAVENTVKEFTQRSDITITLNNQLNGCQLNAHEEIHILQVVREILANAASHSKAKLIEVNLQYSTDDNTATICVDDDGIGIPQQAERANHYGLAIINERADMLGGQINLSRRPSGGTRVELTFTPSTRQ